MASQTPAIKKTSDTNLVEVTLIDKHTHAGKRLVKGDTIKVSQRRKEWLIKHKKVAGE